MFVKNNPVGFKFYKFRVSGYEEHALLMYGPQNVFLDLLLLTGNNYNKCILLPMCFQSQPVDQMSWKLRMYDFQIVSTTNNILFEV